MINVDKDNIFKAFLAGFFSFITIGALALLTYKTSLGLFLMTSFGSSMVLLYGFPESPFAQPKNIFFGHLLTAFIGILFLNYIPLPIFINIALSVGIGIFFYDHFKYCASSRLCKSNHCNIWWCFLRIYNKSNNFWFSNSFVFWGNIK